MPQSSAGEWLASIIGLVVVVGSVGLYIPMITRLARKRCAVGLSVSTWWLKIAGYAAAWLYSGINGYPLANYSENIVMTVECLVVITMVYHLRTDLACSQLVAGLLAIAVSSICVYTWPAAWLLGSMQLGATMLALGAVLPQIVLNFHRGAPGEYSPLTAAMATLGNLLRMYTTFQLVDDKLLLGCYAAGLIVQGFLFVQIMYYGVNERNSLWDVLLSDFKSASGKESPPPKDSVSDETELEGILSLEVQQIKGSIRMLGLCNGRNEFASSTSMSWAAGGSLCSNPASD